MADEETEEVSHHWGYVAVLCSAFLFGIGTTINKILLESMSPLLIAAVTYLIGGLFLGGSNLLGENAKLPSMIKVPERRKTGFVWKDLLLVTLVILFGAVLAPSFYLLGLNSTTAVSAALLGNTETLFTVGIAFVFLRERGRPKDYTAMALLIIGAVILTTNMNFRELSGLGAFLGNLLVVAGCLFWGIENNLSRLLAVKRSLLQIGWLKGVFGGGLLLAVIALADSLVVPSPDSIGYLVIVGVFSVGLSLLFFLFSLQEIGAMRTGVIFSTSSLFGAISAFLILREPISVVQVLAGLLMLFAIYMLSIPAKEKRPA